MTCGCKYYLVQPRTEETAVLHGPYPTLPKAVEGRDKLRKKWAKLGNERVPGMPSVMIVKVFEDVYWE